MYLRIENIVNIEFKQDEHEIIVEGAEGLILATLCDQAEYTIGLEEEEE